MKIPDVFKKKKKKVLKKVMCFSNNAQWCTGPYYLDGAAPLVTDPLQTNFKIGEKKKLDGVGPADNRPSTD